MTDRSDKADRTVRTDSTDRTERTVGTVGTVGTEETDKTDKTDKIRQYRQLHTNGSHNTDMRLSIDSTDRTVSRDRRVRTGMVEKYLYVVFEANYEY